MNAKAQPTGRKSKVRERLNDEMQGMNILPLNTERYLINLNSAANCQSVVY